ncbi:uncharacterized protein LOC129571849 isoform X2 [Sitodiplosis mosellana]|uniref:uncharacterized protein LOC129571849 isoform X2 n=1 Tax=Sitodiplosis mosellana TaxID=263140 RepID=UPI00244493F1|nr:uncharacterized protein LOC129571849 isoform X2 [Sitodiplosis mosellana]
MSKFLIYSFLLCVGLFGISSDNDIDSAANTLQFVNESQAKLKLTNNSNIILVIGNTGSGKSTLVHYVTGDYSKMISKEPENPNFIDFEIEDGLDLESGTIRSSTVSQTFIPEMSVDEKQNVWYDCPGFHSTRNETIEIATTFLIRSVIESASSVKLVLVVDYDSVTRGHSRSDFDELLSHATQLLKTVKPFENSVSVVVTKVPSLKMRGRRYVEIFEDSVKNTSAQFMSEHRTVLLEKGMNEKKVLLIDALLKRPNEDYPKISIFWRPDNTGPLSKIPKLISGRHSILKSVHDHISYTHIQPDDFGAPLSADARLSVKSMIEQLIDNTPTTVQHLINQLQKKLRERISSKANFRKKFQCIALEGFDLRTDDVEEFTRIEQNGKNLNIFESLLENANINSLNVSEAIHSPRIDYKSYLDQFNNFFEKREDEVQSDLISEARRTIQKISTALSETDARLLAEIREKLNRTVFYSKLNILQRGRDVIESIANETTLEQRMQQFSSLIHTFKMTSIDEIELNRTEQLESHLNDLISISKTELIVPTDSWIANSSNTITFLYLEYNWYSFLSQFYEFLASYEIQTNLSAYNVVELSDCNKLRNPKVLSSSEIFNEFTRRLMSRFEFESTPSRLNEINEIIKTTIKSPPKYHCTDEMITIKANFVRSSDLRFSKCQSIKTLKTINVFVVDRFYVDSDLYLNGFENVKFYILANIWTIVKSSTFYLNGFDGSSQTIPSRTNGTAGKPGNPGMNSGNFFGVANEVFNGESLTVELIGGNGGNGQDGTGNQDVEVVYKEQPSDDPKYRMFYKRYPLDSWIEFIRFESGPYNREFDEWNAPYLNSKLTHLLEKEVKLTQAIFSGHCCGVTGTGGAGGRGGESGYYEFIQTGKNRSNLPNKIQRNGMNGRNGRNGRVCKTTGLITHMTGTYKGFNEKGRILINNIKTSYETINDPHCPDEYASNMEIATNPPIDLYLANTIIEYKRFLRENMENPVLCKIIQKTYDAI